MHGGRHRPTYALDVGTDLPDGAAQDAEIVISDPRAIRALAHPARVAVLERLFGGAVLTATECAAEAGLSPSAMSYHLRALERYGLVGRAEPSGDGRERPWRALGRGMRIQAEHTLAGRAAETMLFDRMIDQLRTEAHAAREHRHALQGAENDRPSTFMMTALLLAPDEAKALADKLSEVFRPYEGRSDDPSAAPPDAVAYHVYASLAPRLAPVPGPHPDDADA